VAGSSLPICRKSFPLFFAQDMLFDILCGGICRSLYGDSVPRQRNDHGEGSALFQKSNKTEKALFKELGMFMWCLKLR